MKEDPVLLGGRYEVGELIGRGGMAEVHLGHDTRLGRPVAIKMLRSDLARDQSFLKRFRREAQSSAALNHASIVAVYDSGEDHVTEAGGAEIAVPYMVMEYVEGQTLREILSERGPLGADEACRISEGVLDALAYSHRMGIVHRDIKPANVMVAQDGSVKVMDFGIARAIADTAATMTQTQAVIGTAQYLSPEQAQGQHVDARSDLYSAGCMLYELVTGRPPFVGDSPVSIAYQHVGEQPTSPSSIDPAISQDLSAVVLHSLAKPRDERYQDAESFGADVRAARLGTPVSEAAYASVAALAAGGALAAEATVLTPIEPTEVYAAQPDAAVGAPGADAGNGGGGSATSTMPAVGADGSADGRDSRRGQRRGSTYVMWTLAVIGLLALLGFGASKWMEHQAEADKVTVPTLVGNDREEGLAKLRRAGLRYDEKQQASQSVPEGDIISQDPRGGSRIDPEDRRVTITVSTGPSSVTVPDVRGKTVEEATALLEEAKLTVGTSKRVNSATVPKGQIVATDPEGGATVKPDQTVNLSVSTGQVEVPTVTGKTQDEASADLINAGLQPKTTYKETSEAKEGTVIGQEPGAKKVVDAGSTVTITVAQKAPPSPSPSPSSASPSPTTSGTPTVTPTPTPTAGANRFGLSD